MARSFIPSAATATERTTITTTLTCLPPPPPHKEPVRVFVDMANSTEDDDDDDGDDNDSLPSSSLPEHGVVPLNTGTSSGALALASPAPAPPPLPASRLVLQRETSRATAKSSSSSSSSPSSSSSSSLSRPTIKIYLQYSNEPCREAFLYRDNTLAQLKQAVRTAFDLPTDLALELHCSINNNINNKHEESQTATATTTMISLHEQCRNQDRVYGLIQPNNVIYVALSNQVLTRKKTPRLLQWTKKMGRSWRQSSKKRKQSQSLLSSSLYHDSSVGAASAASLSLPSSNNALATTTALLHHQHYRSVSDVSTMAGERDTSVRSVSFFNTAALTSRATVVPPPSPMVQSWHSAPLLSTPTTTATTTTPEMARAFQCPILLHVMADPVTAEDGVTYDRPAIEGHFARLRNEAAAAAAQQEQEQQNDNDETDDNASHLYDDDMDDDEDSIMGQQRAAATLASAVLLWSPMTREEISDALVPNRAIEQMIVDAVESDNHSILQLTDSDLQDWHERRQDKLEQDRQRAQARKMRLSSCSFFLPDELINAAADNNDHDSNGNDQDHSIPKYPVDTLSKLLRWDRPDYLHDRMGPHDAGLSVVAVAQTDAQATPLTIHNTTYCAVGCCVAKLSSSSSSATTATTMDDVLWCPRCQRAVCRDCRRTQVTDIRSGSHFKPFEICVECVWQVADTIRNDEQRLGLFRQCVLPRLQACQKNVHLAQGQRLRQQAWIDSQCPALRQEMQIMLASTRCKVPNKDISDDETEMDNPKCTSSSLHLSNSSSLHKETTTFHDVLQALGNYPSSTHLPLYLSFPTPAMRHYLQRLREELTIFTQKARPLVISQVQHDESRLTSLCDDFKRAVTLQDSRLVDESKKFQEQLQDIDDQAAASYSCSTGTTLFDNIHTRMNDNDADEEEEELCPFVSSDNETTSRTMARVVLRMCPFCRTGPFDRSPARGGCTNCGGGGREGFDQWPLWDDVPGPH